MYVYISWCHIPMEPQENMRQAIQRHSASAPGQSGDPWSQRCFWHQWKFALCIYLPHYIYIYIYIYLNIYIYVYIYIYLYIFIYTHISEEVHVLKTYIYTHSNYLQFGGMAIDALIKANMPFFQRNPSLHVETGVPLLYQSMPHIALVPWPLFWCAWWVSGPFRPSHPMIWRRVQLIVQVEARGYGGMAMDGMRPKSKFQHSMHPYLPHKLHSWQVKRQQETIHRYNFLQFLT